MAGDADDIEIKVNAVDENNVVLLECGEVGTLKGICFGEHDIVYARADGE